MTERVLVTGALGLVGTAVVAELVRDGRHVVATDLDSPPNRKLAGRLPRSGRLELRWADLTDDAAVRALVTEVEPGTIVHLAAVIPPFCYKGRDLARKVNVGATASLVHAASALASPPRLVVASSVAVYGARNPCRHPDVLTADTPVGPVDLYGSHKLGAEAAVTSSDLDWVILRLGGVLSSELRMTSAGKDFLLLDAALPTDGRLQTVDVRDVARAFGAALDTDATQEVFLIGGDATHRCRQGELTSTVFAAMGLAGALPRGRPGDRESDTDWFPTDWMDTSRAQAVLRFQQHSLPDLLAEVRARVGWMRWPLRAVAPLMRAYLQRNSPTRGLEGRHARPWDAIRHTWGDPSVESG